LDVIEGAMRELLGESVLIRTRRAGPLAGAGAAEGAIAVVLAPVEARGPFARGVLVEAEDALAVMIAARVVKRPNPVVVSTGGARAAGLAGAVAAFAGAVARRAHGDHPLCIAAAGVAAPLEEELLRLDPGAVALSLTVLVGDDAFSARVAMSTAQAAATPCPSWNLGALLRLDATPLSMPIVALATTSTVADVGVLRPGDVFFPGPSQLAHSASGPTGPVLLSPPSYEVGIRARLLDDSHLVLEGESEPLLAAAETDMSERDEKAALLTALGEVPVVVRVEIGEACMAAREWASLGRGDVVVLGRRVGDYVVMRIGGLPVARGELVEVDGEVGVRIVERLSGGPTVS
jgi:flagellar motor switch/type III secretory pathway protein FliN